MVLEDVRRLIERMNTDEAFRKRVLAAPDVAEQVRLALEAEQASVVRGSHGHLRPLS